MGDTAAAAVVTLQRGHFTLEVTENLVVAGFELSAAADARTVIDVGGTVTHVQGVAVDGREHFCAVLESIVDTDLIKFTVCAPGTSAAETTMEPEPELSAPSQGGGLVLQIDMPERTVTAVFDKPGPMGVQFLKGVEPITVGKIVPGFPAALVPGLTEGMLLQKVEDVDVLAMTYEEVHREIMSRGRPLRLVFLPVPTTRASRAPSTSPVSTRTPQRRRAVSKTAATPRPVVDMWCSWCFSRERHICISTRRMWRNIHLCQGCRKHTLKCGNSETCGAMTRKNGDVEEPLCCLCTGTVSVWGRVPAWESKWCSWCFTRTKQSLVQHKTKFGRAVWSCVGCNQNTVKCKKCESGVARSHPTSADDCCYACRGFIDSWTPPLSTALRTQSPESSSVVDMDEEAKGLASHIKLNQAKFVINGNCSWCFTLQPHTLHRTNRVRRDVHSCGHCLMQTARCANFATRRCHGMVRVGKIFISDLCAACEGNLGAEHHTNDCSETWPSLRTRASEKFDRMRTMKEITRDLQRLSKEKQQAYERGMIRPFLLMVSMQSRDRNRIACLLGWTTPQTRYFGDAHAESWDIISRPMKGILACTSESWETLNPASASCNWYDSVHRCMSMGFGEGKQMFKAKWASTQEWCKMPNTPQVRALEDSFIQKMADMQRAQMTEKQRTAMRTARAKLGTSEEMHQVTAKMNAMHVDERVQAYAMDTMWLAYYAANSTGAGGAVVLTAGAKVMSNIGGTVGTALGGFMGSAGLGIAFFAMGWGFLAAEVLHHTFGAAVAKLFPVVLSIAHQRVALLTHGLAIDQFYPREYTRATELDTALGSDTLTGMVTFASPQAKALKPAPSILFSDKSVGSLEQKLQRAESTYNEKVLPEATRMLEQARAREGLLNAGADLVKSAQTMSTTLKTGEGGFSLAKDVIGGSKNKTLDASQVLIATTAAVSDAFNASRRMEQDDIDKIKAQATTVLSEAKEILESNEGVRKVVQKGQEMLRATQVMSGSDDTSTTADLHLLKNGLAMISTVRDKNDGTNLLENNKEFVRQLKTMGVKYLEAALTGLAIPRIYGEKEWGSYVIEGLALKRLAFLPDMISVDVDEGITLVVQNISAEFQNFSWRYNKDKSFPRTSDAGHAGASAVDLSASLGFQLRLDERGIPVPDDITSDVTLGALNIEVRQSLMGREWLLNMLLNVFRETIKDRVLDEIRFQFHNTMNRLRSSILNLVQALGSNGLNLAQKAKEEKKRIVDTAKGRQVQEPEPQLLPEEKVQELEEEKVPDRRGAPQQVFDVVPGTDTANIGGHFDADALLLTGSDEESEGSGVEPTPVHSPLCEDDRDARSPLPPGWEDSGRPINAPPLPGRQRPVPVARCAVYPPQSNHHWIYLGFNLFVDGLSPRILALFVPGRRTYF